MQWAISKLSIYNWKVYLWVSHRQLMFLLHSFWHCTQSVACCMHWHHVLFVLTLLVRELFQFRVSVEYEIVKDLLFSAFIPPVSIFKCFFHSLLATPCSFCCSADSQQMNPTGLGWLLFDISYTCWLSYCNEPEWDVETLLVSSAESTLHSQNMKDLCTCLLHSISFHSKLITITTHWRSVHD